MSHFNYKISLYIKLTVMVSTVRVFDEIVCDEIISAGSTFSRPGIE